MKLWIRTQDRECLTKVNHLYIYEEGNNIYVINQQDDITLGEYKTKERALEVLDEIQDIIYPKLICTGDYPSDITKELMTSNVRGMFYDDTIMKFEQLENYIYNMPKE